MGLLDIEGIYDGQWGEPQGPALERLYRGPKVRRDREGVPGARPVTKIKDRGEQIRLGGILGERPTGSLNDTVMVEIGLPLGMVEGAKELGNLDEVVREALREKLAREGKSWWGPRFLQMIGLPEI